MDVSPARLLLRSLGCAVVFSVLPACCAAQDYTIKNLGTLGGNWVTVQAVNRLGQVSGYAYNADGQLHAFRWKDGTLTDLGTLGGSWSVAHCINNAGTVGGYAQTPFNAAVDAALWKSNTASDAGVGSDSQVFGVNTKGQIAGVAGNRGYFFDGTNLSIIGTFGGSSSIAYGVNDAKMVVGTAYDASSYPRPFVWINGTLKDLGDLPGGILGHALAINNSKQVVGRCYIPSAGDRAYLFQLNTLGLVTKRTNLGVFSGGGNSVAYGLNDEGAVVGVSQIDYNGTQRACAWMDGVMQDLNILVPADSGWLLTDAYGINEARQVVGNGLLNGVACGFIMTLANPVPRLKVSPATIAGSLTASGKVYLNQAAPAGGAVVSLSSSDPSVHPPATVTIKAGFVSTTFKMPTDAVATRRSTTITASYGGGSISSNLTVRPIGVKTLVLSPTSISSGGDSAATITLEAPAAPGDITVKVSSSNAGLAAPTASSITVPAGSTTATFTVHTAAGMTGSATIKATASGTSKGAVITVL